MRKAFALLALPFLLSAATGSFITGQVAPTATHLYENPTVIHLPCGINLDTRHVDTGLPATLMLSAQQKGVGTYLVQFDGPIYAHERRTLEQTGAVIEGYLPHYVYIVRMDQATQAEVETLPGVSWVGNYEPGYKLCPEIDLEASFPEKLVVTLYSGTSGEAIREAVEVLGGELLCWETTKWQTFVHIMLAPNKLPELIHEPHIKWVEPYHQPYLMNAQAQWVIQTWEQDNRRIWDEGLTGEGQIITSLDSGISPSHNFFRDPSVPINSFGDYPTHRKIIGYEKSWDIPEITFGDEIGHGTHTGGSIAGNDRPVEGSSENIGMAPDAKLFVLDGGGGGGGIYHYPSLEASLNIAYNGNSAGGARISSNSWGSQGTPSYNAGCIGADQAMWNRPDFLLMFSGGNTSQGTYTGSPANAKNVVCVGGCLNGASANLHWSGSSRGPTLDGRVRPDIVAPAADVTSSYPSSQDAEITWSGTSMACPVAAGNAALIRQYFTEGWYPSGTPTGYNAGFAPSAALLKAMMINSVETDFTGHPVPDNYIGWGRPKLDNVLYFPGDARELAVVDFDEGLETGSQFLGTINISGNGEPLRITLNWTDFPGQQYASPALVNDLNLEVISPSSKVYRGNNFDENVSIENGSFDTKNPTENIFIDSPETGKWEIRIHANNVPYGPQPFALVVTGELSNLITTAASITEVTVDDEGQSNPNWNMDPGENVTLYVEITNAGSQSLHNVTATLSTSSSHVTITDNNSSYGTINAGAYAEGDGFGVSVSSSAPHQSLVEFNLTFSSTELSGDLGGFELPIAPNYEWASHDIGNVTLTVTNYGAIGYMSPPALDDYYGYYGEGFRYPKDDYPSWLYYASFAAGDSSTYINDRFYGEDENRRNALDWEVSADPDGMITIGRHVHSDQDSRAVFTDQGNLNPKGLRVWQYGYAWENKDYVILKFVLENTGSSDLPTMYAGIIADYDMGTEPAFAQTNFAGTDQDLNLAYMKQGDTDNPHIGIKLLAGTKANVSLLENPVYIYNEDQRVWNEDYCFRFISGDLSFASDPDSTDWTVVVSAGPFDLAYGETDTVAFAFLAGDNLSDLRANAQDAQQTWDTMDFTTVEEKPYETPTLNLALSPELLTGKGSILFSLPAASHARVDIYDLSGRRVRKLVDGHLTAGKHEIYWNGRDQKGHTVSNGVYFITLTTNDARVVQKAVIVR